MGSSSVRLTLLRASPDNSFEHQIICVTRAFCIISYLYHMCIMNCIMCVKSYQYAYMYNLSTRCNFVSIVPKNIVQFALLSAETAFSFEFDWQQSAEVCYEHCYVLCSVQFEKSVQSCIGQCWLCSMQCALWKSYALCIGQAGSLGGLNWRPWIFLCHCLKLPALNTAHTAHCS